MGGRGRGRGATERPPPPPRSLNVNKFAAARAPELESLHAAIAARLNDDFRIARGKRRRTTGHRVAESRRRKRPRLGDVKVDPTAAEKPPSRRARRMMEFRANPASGFSASGDGTRRLRTHLWHAKRFTMVKRWGFHLPLGLQGRGRGSRAVLKRLKSGALMHDASYCHPIQLEGSEVYILAILGKVLQPSPSNASNISEEVLGGVLYENALLYHVGTPLAKLIGPVIYMWRPSMRAMRDDDCNAEHAPLPNGRNVFVENECSTSYRQLWIWIHAASFKEGFDALKFACQKQMNETGISVNCFSLEGYFAKLEIMGSKATQILPKILHPVSESYAVSTHSMANTDIQAQKSLFLHHADQLPSRAILSLLVHDPRKLPSNQTEPVAGEPSSGLQNYIADEVVQDSNSLSSGVSTKNDEFWLSMWSKPEAYGTFLSDSKDLWGSTDKLNPPVSDNIICTEKHHKRLKQFNLDLAEDGTPDIEAEDSLGQSFPVLLLKHLNQGNLGTRWSVILPLCWVKVFWMGLISHGARAIGLRERRWISCNNGLPCFPFDFPDSKAYFLCMAEEATAFDKEAERRPLAVRPLRVPLPPLWDCLRTPMKKVPDIIRDPQTLDTQHCGEVAGEISLINPENVDLQSASEHAGASFRGFIIRTSGVLGKYVEEIHDKHLLIFPDFTMRDKGFSELIDSNKLSAFANINLIPADRELCFVRVQLHAYKEGVFEEGAIVCAPILTDLSLWSSRSEDVGELQIPESFVGSYFTEQDSGKWELQVPEDPSTLWSFRWPIGFVTTGFVRGSSKPVAEAFCEARMFSLLRGQQWSQLQTARCEIFVLVRNVRSTAYRRALATIVLEQQKEDLEFM